MKVTTLIKNPNIYTCNAYYVRGSWNAIADMNTLIDIGTDGFIIKELEEINSGVGKRKIDQVIITHEHFDHCAGLKEIKDIYNPTVFSHSLLYGTDVQIKEELKVRIGENDALIIHTPVHSNDSVCIYCESEKTLFSGDTPLFIKSSGGTYSAYFVDLLKHLCKLKIEKIYSGHDQPILSNAHEILQNTLRNVLNSKVVK